MTPDTSASTLIALLQARARERPDLAAYTFLLDGGEGQVTLSFAQLDAQARDIAARLQAQGAQGERVLLLYPPGLDYVAGFFGCLYAGAVAVPVYPPRPDRPLHRFLSILEDAEPVCALATDFVVSMGEQLLADHRPLTWLATDTLDGSWRDRWVDPGVGPEQLAFLQYTSGSTASPKGVMVTHRNLLHNQTLIQRAFGTGQASRVVGWLPLYHDMGLIGNVLHPLWLGTSCVLLSPLEFLKEPLRWLQAISDFQGTVSGGPNFAFDLCARKIPLEARRRLDLSRWTVAFNGAEPIRPETLDRFAEAFAVSGFRPEAFVPCYGLAEGTLLVSGGKPEPRTRAFDGAALEQHRAVAAQGASARPLVACGEAWSVKVVEPGSLAELPPGGVGELWVQGPSVAQGYWRRPEVSEATFRAVTTGGEGPFLRTGDLGFIDGGQLFVAGRIKDLLIIRGRNHYPQDLELTAEKSHPLLRPGCGVAVALEVAGEERLLVVHEVTKAEGLDPAPVVEAIRQAIAREHELQVHAVVLIAPRSIPKTSSGKLQRAACRAAYLAGELEVVGGSALEASPGEGPGAPPTFPAPPAAAAAAPAAPASVASAPATRPPAELSVWLAEAFAARLGVAPAAIDLDAPASSFALDSLQLVELTHDLETAFGLTVPLEVFFGPTPLREVALRVGGAAGTQALGERDWTARDWPLSEGQRALWLLNQLEPTSASYNVPAALEVKGGLDVEALRRAFGALAERHPLLRSRFPAVDGAPVQRVAPATELPFAVERVAAAELVARANAEAARPFSLQTELPMRVLVLDPGDSTHALVVVLHHLVTDFWSQGLLLKELGVLYLAEKQGRPAGLAPVRATYQDHVAAQARQLAGAEGERLAQYWLGQLAGELPVLELPTARPRPEVQSLRGAVEEVAFDAAFTERLRRFAQAHHASPFMVLLAAFQALLHRYTGQADLVVGSVATGRGRADQGAVPGYFANPIALRSHLAPGQPFEDFLAATRERVLGALAHQDYPFASLVTRLKPRRDPARSPLFQAMFVLQKGAGPDGEALTGFAMNAPGAHLAWADLELGALPLQQRWAQFDLSLTAGVVDGRLQASFDYCVDLFDAAFVKALAAHFSVLLRGLLEQPTRAVQEAPLLGMAERTTQLAAWNETQVPLTGPATVHGWFAEQARATPRAVALVCGGQQLDYQTLDRRSNQLAHRLLALGVGPEQVVGLCLERSVELVVAMLGVLKAGAAYLPLDPQAPAGRSRLMLSESGARLVLAGPGLAEGLGPLPTLALDEALAREPGDSPAVAVAPEGLACVVFTSGSTGAPKGTMLEHRSLKNLVASFLASYRPTASDRMLPVTAIASASFVGEVYPLLCAGGALVIPSREEMLDEQRLEALIAAAGVTLLSTLPSRLATLRSAEQSLGRVRLVLSGGEALSASELPRLGAGLTLVNGYGLTETCVCSTFHLVSRQELEGGGAPSLGRPIQNTRVYVLGPALEPLPVGCAGELYIGGLGLARGYRGRPGATAERFLPSPFGEGERLYRTGDRARWSPDGTLAFLGRVDQQVKLRGHRIELEELEATLKRHPAVRDAAVLLRGERAEDRRLVAYVAGKATAGELLAFLRERLPEHMVPATFMVLEALPLTAAGKVDRRALPEPTSGRPELEAAYVAPRDELEERIAAVWKAHLQVDQVGTSDNFFDLGGHSLLLVKVHAELKRVLQRELTLVDLFRFPTVGTLAAHLAPPGSVPAPAAPRAPRAAPASDQPIAIIGVAGRFPGASSPTRLWDNLTRGVESITFFTVQELRAAGVDQALLDDPNYIKANGIIDDIDRFDAHFFNLSPRESELMDPQHRVFLECAWEALEVAGYDSLRYPGRVGVFAGCSMNTYLLMNLLSHLKLVASVDTLQASLGNDKDPLTSRVSYKLDLKGPSITIQSASSTSLVAVHVACQTLLSGACEMALAGGVSIHLPSKSGYLFQEGGTTARDGHCRAFDADASGFVSGKGAGVVLLKRLSDALADGDHIHAVIRGSACNNDGALKVSYTAPSVEGQVDVYRQAMAAARVEPKDIGYIECHGTGTALGDPIEIAALTQAFGGAPLEKASCLLGSLKTNIGHLDNAAGVCGLIKATLCVEHGKLVPTLHFKKANPQIDFDATPFAVNTEYRDWPRSPRIAGVTSLGMGGTNAHLILAEAPARPPSGPSRGQQLFLLSAKTETALAAMSEQLAVHLEAQPALSLADAAYTLHVGRRLFKHRRAVVAASREEALAALRAPERKAGSGAERDRPVAFLFPGQGSQYVDMARGLSASEPRFKAELDRACELLVPELGFDLRTRLFPAEGEDREAAATALAQTAVTQPALFAVEYALARLLMSWGLQPEALLGHSLGEFVAACLAGVFRLEDALALVAARGRFMQQMEPGSMLAVPLPAAVVEARLPPGLGLAAINHPESSVVSGPTPAIQALAAALAAEGVEGRLLQTSHAFHSAMLDRAVPLLLARVKAVTLSPPRLKVLSNLSGTWLTEAEATDPRYWVRQMREPVRFAPAVAELLKSPTRLCVEVGPGQVLTGLVRSHPARTPRHEVVPLLRHPRETADDQRVLLQGLGKLWAAGVELGTEGFWADQSRRRVPLPTYPFERKRHWVEPRAAVEAVAVADVRQPPGDWLHALAWKEAPRARAATRPGPAPVTWLVSEGGELGPALAEALRAQGAPLTVLTPGAGFERQGEGAATVAFEDEQAWERALAGLPAPARVVWLATGEASLGGAFFAPVALARALGRRGGAALELAFVTTGLHDVTGQESLEPVRASVLGAARVIPLELPRVRCRVLDVVPGPQVAAQVAEELAQGGAEPELALRGSRRWAPSHQPLPPAEAPLAPAREGGVYLVTGGLGGIGLELALDLASRAPGARLALVARTWLPPRAEWASRARAGDALARQLQRVLELEQRHGAQVEVFGADVSREAEEVVQRVLRRFGALHGVIHAAGVPGGGLLQLRPRTAQEAVFAGKVHGALGLARALEGMELDFVLLCSSLTAVVPMPGQADYVAANAVLDALARAQARRGRPWTSINWDAWREVGMAARAGAEPELAAWRGSLLQDGLSNAEGVRCARAALATGLSQVVVSTHPLALRLAARRSIADAPTQAPTGAPAEASAPGLAPVPEGEVEQHIVSLWKELLGVDAVGLDDNFFDLGGSSLVGITLINRLRSELQVKLSEVGLFQAPTVRTLSALVREARAPAPTGPATTAPAPAPVLDEAASRGQRRRELRTRRPGGDHE